MQKTIVVFMSVLICHFCLQNVFGQDREIANKYLDNKSVKPLKFNNNENLQSIVTSSVEHTLKLFASKNLKPDEIAVTLINAKDANNLSMAHYRGEAKIYPASVVKMFYMVALFRQLEDGTVKMTPELKRGLTNMVVDSGNESTGYILDVLTKTSSGAELPENEFKEWSYKRNAVNRYFQSIGYQNINVSQKTHCEDAWGVEQQFRGYQNKNRNMLTTNATARLMAEIALGKAVTPERSQEMMNLMSRDWEKTKSNQFYQEFISHALTPGTKLWSKEGFTSKTRHDVAYLETAQGQKLILAIFTENHANEQEIIPSITRRILKGLGEK